MSTINPKADSPNNITINEDKKQIVIESSDTHKKLDINTGQTVNILNVSAVGPQGPEGPVGNVDPEDSINLTNITASGDISASGTSTGSFGQGYIVDKLGIGQTAPTAQLHITNTDGNAHIKLDSAGDAKDSYITFAATDESSNWAIGQDDNDNNFRISNGASLGGADIVIVDGGGIDITGHITASGNISSSGGDILGFNSASFNYITASIIDVDGDTIRFGGEPFTKANIQALKQGKSLKSLKSGRTAPDLLGDDLFLSGSITASGNISASGDLISNNLFVGNNAKMGVEPNLPTYMMLSHKDQFTYTDFAVAQNSAGSTYCNAEADERVYLSLGGAPKLIVSDNKVAIASSGGGNMNIPKELTVVGDISASGDYYTDGNIAKIQHITASGNISGSSITAFSGQDLILTREIKVGGASSQGAAGVSVNGNISASGYVYGTRLYVEDLALAKSTTATNLSLGSQGLQLTNITASGDISASGTIIGKINLIDTSEDDTKYIVMAEGPGGSLAQVTNGFSFNPSSDTLLLGGVMSLAGQVGDITGVRDLTISRNISNVNTTHITASGNISASGDLYVDNAFLGSATGYANSLTLQHTAVAAALTEWSLQQTADGATSINSAADQPILFAQNTTNRMVIQSGSGNVQIGASITPTKTLTVEGDISASGTIYAGKVGSQVIIENGHITASGDISSSGRITTDNLTVNTNQLMASGYIQFATAGDHFKLGATTRLTLGTTNTFVGAISSSKVMVGGASGSVHGITVAGDISASGDLHLQTGESIYFKTATTGTQYINSDGDNILIKGGLNINTIGNSGKELTVEGDISASGATYYKKNTIANDDATPTVAGGTYFETGTNTDTITTFDGGSMGQIIYVISKAAITYDVTGTTLKCGTTDLVTADTDLTSWLYDGTNWTCLGFTDQSDDLS